MGIFLVSAEHVAYLTTTYADIACRNVEIWTNVTGEFKHESLAETHHLSVGLATGREIRATLGTTHRKGCERVLEGLLEGKELQDTEVHRLVETNTTLVGANGVVVLHAVTHVGLDVALVVHPGDAELIDAIGDAKTLDQVYLVKLGVLVVGLLDGGKNFFYGLMVLGLVRKSAFQILKNFFRIHRL